MEKKHFYDMYGANLHSGDTVVFADKDCLYEAHFVSGVVEGHFKGMLQLERNGYTFFRESKNVKKI